MNLKIISAGAGSGKTYRLTQEMFKLLQSNVRASGIIATTFTKKAAAELQERVRTKLLEEGLPQAANDLSNALIGTVNALGVKLLKRFAFEAGVSPQTDVIAEEDQQMMFNLSLSQILTQERVERMNVLSDKLGVNKKATHDWRKDIKNITDVARSNNFTIETLQKSKHLSFQTFQKILFAEVEQTHEEAVFGQEMIHISNKMLLNNPTQHSIPKETALWNSTIFHDKLDLLLAEVVLKLQSGKDSTKDTQAAINDFKLYRREIALRGTLYWHQIVRISKTKVGAKSREVVQEVMDYANKHIQLPEFQQDIHDYIELIFDIASDALQEFDRYKKQRGLIDYIDMEVHINRLMDHPDVRAVLEDELDLLMVDEFQDTSPIQLEIFLKMSRIAKNSIWVGDPKQSIYGFRGADPQLMQAIIEQTGGIKDEDILKKSWRSRPDVVHLTNSLFCKTFKDLPKEQIALVPERKDLAGQTDALVHWHFNPDGEKRPPGSPWMENCIADSLKLFLSQEPSIQMARKSNKKLTRPILPKDVVILCRSNARCNSMAEALHRAGLKASISRNGLLQTAEAKLVMACLRFILNRHDSLAIAEILVLAAHQDIGAVLDDRLEYLAKLGESYDWRWAVENAIILKINELRKTVTELSPVEILNLMLEELDLWRIVSGYGNAFQRVENIDQLRFFAKQYEDNCNRLHIAASLGGFLVWLNKLSVEEKDAQSAGESAEAVHVMTYHKSKGLEFPVVILHDLDTKLRNEVFGVHIIPEKETVDLDNLLGNRWLRFWINPYADQLKNTKLEQAIDASEAKKKVTQAALAEEARLLYVGITRARDYLIFPTTLTPTRWLNRAWHENEEIATFDQGNQTFFEWEKKDLVKYFEAFWYPKLFTHADAPPENIRFLETRAGKKAGKPYKIDPERDYFAYEMSFQFAPTERYTPAIAIKDTDKTGRVAKLNRSFWHGDNPDYSAVQRLQIAKNMLERYELDDTIDYHALPKQTSDFYNFIQKKYKKAVIKRRYPIRYHHRKRLLETQIDCLVEHDGGIALFQTNDYVGNPMKLRQEAMKQTGLLYLCQKMMTQLHDAPEITTFAHFPLMGVVLEIKMSTI